MPPETPKRLGENQAQRKRDQYKRAGTLLIATGLALMGFSYFFIGDLGTMFSSQLPGASDWAFIDSWTAFGGLCILVLGMIYAYATMLVSDNDLLS